jgi:ankyrin repeat protein
MGSCSSLPHASSRRKLPAVSETKRTCRFDERTREGQNMAARSTERVTWAASFVTLLLWTPLAVVEANQVHGELKHGSATQALTLLKKQPSLVRSRDGLKCTPLHLAAQHGHVDVVRWLLAHKAEVNARAYNGFTPLHLTKSASVAKLLLKSGADPNQRDSWCMTALQEAARYGHLQVVNAIVEAGYPLDLVSALMLGKRDVAKKIIHERPAIVRGAPHSWDLWGNTSPLGIAAGQGDKEMVLLLLEAGAPVNGGTYMPNAGGTATPLYNAVRAGHVEVVEILCEAGADCNVIGGKYYRSLLDYASKRSDKRIVDLLVKYGARQNAPQSPEPGVRD